MRKQNAELLKTVALRVAKKHGKAISKDIEKYVKGKELTQHEIKRIYKLTSGFLHYSILN